MPLLDLFRQKQPPTSVEVEAALQGDQSLEEARALVLTAREARQRAIADPEYRQENLLKLDVAVREAELRLERAEVFRARAGEALEAARVREDAERRAEVYAAAKRAAPQVKRLAAEYDAKARDLLQTLHKLYLLEAQVFDANAVRPDGAPRIASPEAEVRGGGRQAMVASQLYLALSDGTLLWAGGGATEYAEPGRMAREVADAIAERLAP